MKCAPDHSRATSPAFAVKPRLIRQLFLPPLILLLTVSLGYAGYRASLYSGIRALSESGERQLELNGRAVESEINKFTFLPSLLELEGSVSTLLADPDAEGHRQAVNDYLEGLNRRSHSSAIYVLDTTGRVQASSNWRDANSYLGEDLSFRAYFQDAVRGQDGRFYGIGTTTGEPGYYLAHGLEEHGKIVGVAVVKVRMESLEERWQKARLEAFVSDENGIIILSSDPARRLKSVRPLTPEIKERLARSLQYYWFSLTELQPLERETLADGVERLSFPAAGSQREVSYLAQTRELKDTPWHFTLLTPLQDLRREAVIQGVLVAVAFGLVAFFLIAWNERRKVIATRLAAREALEEANSLLERRIAERTENLRASNDRLKSQIRERRQAEETLR
ncbi:cache domain-containing protein, partial [Pseudomonas sp.]